MAKIIDGKAISKAIKDEVKQQVEEWKQQGITVTLAVIQVGSNQASTVYVNNKKKACEYTGIRSLSYELPEKTTQEELLSLVRELNDREDVNGILVQLPLPAHMDEDEVINVVPCSLGELEDMIYTGKITDGKTIAAIMAYARKYRSEDKKDTMVKG